MPWRAHHSSCLFVLCPVFQTLPHRLTGGTVVCLVAPKSFERVAAIDGFLQLVLKQKVRLFCSDSISMRRVGCYLQAAQVLEFTVDRS